jgi:hypothetical protein
MLKSFDTTKTKLVHSKLQLLMEESIIDESI